jgi:hypothetical protein
MAKLGSSIDARLLRISPYAIRAMEMGGAGIGAGFESLGQSAGRAIKSYAEMKEEQRLTEEEKEEQRQKEKNAINYIGRLTNPATDERYTVEQARDIVNAIGPEKAVSTIESQINTGNRIQAEKDLTEATIAAQKLIAEQDRIFAAMETALRIKENIVTAMTRSNTDIEIATLEGKDDSVINALRADLNVLKTRLNEANRKITDTQARDNLFKKANTAKNNLTNTTWVDKATPDQLRQAVNDFKAADNEWVSSDGQTLRQFYGYTDHLTLQDRLPTGIVDAIEKVSGMDPEKPDPEKTFNTINLGGESGDGSSAGVHPPMLYPSEEAPTDANVPPPEKAPATGIAGVTTGFTGDTPYEPTENLEVSAGRVAKFLFDRGEYTKAQQTLRADLQKFLTDNKAPPIEWLKTLDDNPHLDDEQIRKFVDNFKSTLPPEKRKHITFDSISNYFN